MFLEPLKKFFRGAWTRVALMTVLLAGGGIAAEAQPPVKENAPVPAETAATIPAFSWLPQERDTKGIDTLRAEFSRTKLGQDLLQMADSLGAKIFYDTMGTKKTRIAYYDYHDKSLHLGRNADMEKLIHTLAHELRHLWQDAWLADHKVEDAALVPEHIFALRQYLEADADAFAAYFYADRLQQLNMPAVTYMAASDLRQAQDLREHQAAAGAHDAAYYRDTTLLQSFDELDSYLGKHLQIAQEGKGKVQQAVDSATTALMQNFSRRAAKKILLDLYRRLDAESDENFAAYLRRFGGVSLDTTAATAFKDVSTADMLKKFPLDAFWYNDMEMGVDILGMHTSDYNKSLENAAKLAHDLFGNAAQKKADFLSKKRDAVAIVTRPF